jgi:transposase
MSRILPPRNNDDQSPRFVGLDLGKRQSQIAVLDSSGKQIYSRRIDTTLNTFSQLAGELTDNDRVAMEVTTNSFAIARLLKRSPARITISDPIKTRLIAEAKVSTDKIDARVLAELDRADYLPSVWLPDRDTEELRRLMSDRQSLVDRRTELKNRIHSVLHRNLIEYMFTDLFGGLGRAALDSALSDDPKVDWNLEPLEKTRLRYIVDELDRLKADLDHIEAVIASFIAQRPKLLNAVDRLLSINGVSLVVAAGLIGAVGEAARFKKAKKLASYFGLVPSTSQTGKLKYYHGRITKRGRAQARWLLIEAAEHLSKAPGPLRSLFLRIKKKRNHNVAVVAVARKLAELVWHLLTKEEDYIYSIPRLTDEKRARVRHLAYGVKSRSGPNGKARSPLYGTGLAGRKVKTQIIRQASLQAERCYSETVSDRAARKDTRVKGEKDHVDGFDPLRPSPVDWQAVLEQVARSLGSNPSAQCERLIRLKGST